MHNEIHKIVIEDCLKRFEQMGVYAYQDDDSSIFVGVAPGVDVQISKAEIIFRADEWLNQQA